MKLVANALNGSYLRNILPPTGTEVDGVLATIAYGDDEQTLIRHTLDNKFRLDIWVRYDETVPVAPKLLRWLLENQRNNIFCILVPDMLHSKVIWWRGYGAYIGSANLTDRAWYSNIEAGLFISESDLVANGLDQQLEEYFENIKDIDKAFPLTREIIDELSQIQKLRNKSDLDRESAKLRSRDKWEGLKFAQSRQAKKDRKKENFRQEWESTISIIRNIAQQIENFRPKWVEDSVPSLWHVDQFLHGYYYNVVRDGNSHPYEEYYQRHKANPQNALYDALNWWSKLPEPPSNEDHALYRTAPRIRELLAKEKILLLTSSEFEEICEYTHSTKDHIIKLPTSTIGRPEAESMTLNERLPYFAKTILGFQNKRGENVLQLLDFVLYGGKEKNMWERIFLAGHDEEYRIAHYGTNSIAEVAGWTKPEISPPRNGRTNKALRALGYDVRIVF